MESEQIQEKINGIKKQFFSALDDYKKYYVYYNKNPEVDEFYNYYSNSKGQLQTMSKDLYSLSNYIKQSIENLDDELKETSENLEKEKEKNEEMLKTIAKLENTQNGSEILIDDTKKKYNIQYYINLLIFIGILILIIFFVNLSKADDYFNFNLFKLKYWTTGYIN